MLSSRRALFRLLPLLAAAAVIQGACNEPPSTLLAPDAGDPPLYPYPLKRDCPPEQPVAGEIALARNIILILGDGMGPAEVEAGRLEQGRELAWDSLPGPVYVMTDSLSTDTSGNPDAVPTDSAASATAMATGVRTVNGALGVDAYGNPHETVLELARAAGKATALVTTSSLYDASPMAFAVHVPQRGMTDAILQQLLTATRPDVIMGGAQDAFSRDGGAYASIAEAAGYHLVHDAAELVLWQPESQPMLLGLLSSTYASPNSPSLWPTTPAIVRDSTTADPPLATMVVRALERLTSDPDGFFLFIENENPDTLGHISPMVPEFSLAAMPLEVATLSAATDIVLDWISENSSFDDTLIVVTADHETGDYVVPGNVLSRARYQTGAHTRKPVPVWARGPGSENLDSLCRVSDLFALFTGRLPAPSTADAAR